MGQIVDILNRSNETWHFVCVVNEKIANNFYFNSILSTREPISMHFISDNVSIIG